MQDYLANVFQFHAGSIKGALVYLDSRLLNRVSIPRWFD